MRAFARLVLKGKSPRIADAVSPGGSGDAFGGLNETERTVLREVTSMGVPLRGWSNRTYLLGLEDAQGLMGFRDTVRNLDPTYAEDFWSKPGYLGTEISPLGDIVRAAKVEHEAAVTRVEGNSKIELASVPAHGHVRNFEYTLIDDESIPLGQ